MYLKILLFTVCLSMVLAIQVFGQAEGEKASTNKIDVDELSYSEALAIIKGETKIDQDEYLKFHYDLVRKYLMIVLGHRTSIVRLLHNTDADSRGELIKESGAYLKSFTFLTEIIKESISHNVKIELLEFHLYCKKLVPYQKRIFSIIALLNDTYGYASSKAQFSANILTSGGELDLAGFRELSDILGKIGQLCKKNK